jgi:hypothetical protein
MITITSQLAVVSPAVFAFVASAALADDFEIDWYTVDGGGVKSPKKADATGSARGTIAEPGPTAESGEVVWQMSLEKPRNGPGACSGCCERPSLRANNDPPTPSRPA